MKEELLYIVDNILRLAKECSPQWAREGIESSCAQLKTKLENGLTTPEQYAKLLEHEERIRNEQQQAQERAREQVASTNDQFGGVLRTSLAERGVHLESEQGVRNN